MQIYDHVHIDIRPGARSIYIHVHIDIRRRACRYTTSACEYTATRTWMHSHMHVSTLSHVYGYAIMCLYCMYLDLLHMGGWFPKRLRFLLVGVGGGGWYPK
jgi:hypothetical protein